MDQSKKKPDYVVTVSALFPEVKGAFCHQQGRGQGSTLPTAMARAWANLLHQPGLKRKRFSLVTAKVSVGRRIEEISTEVQ